MCAGCKQARTSFECFSSCPLCRISASFVQSNSLLKKLCTMRTEARKSVEEHGGKIAVNSGTGRSCIDHKGYTKNEWPEMVPSLMKELGFSPEDPQA